MWTKPNNIYNRNRSTELEQSFVRLVCCLILVFYISILSEKGLINIAVVHMYIVAVFFSLIIIVWTYFYPGVNHIRRIIGMLADIGTTTYAMSVSGDSTSPLVIIYLWVTIGNGIRFGVVYLYLSMAMSIFGFALVSKFSPFWSQHHTLDIGMILLMILLPLYTGFLLTRLKHAITEARSANEAKSQFLANMSHEIRTPLNGVIGMTEMMSVTQLNSEQKDFVSTIQASAHTLLALIEDILDISKIEAGKTSIEHTEFDLHLLLNTTIKMLRPQAVDKNLSLHLHIAADTPYKLYGDAPHLRQILINLISNAIKFTHNGGIEVTVKAIDISPSKTKLRFEVIDTGIGIPEEAQEKIFEKFTQANQTISREFGGTGLGTAISKQLVDLMSGQINVSSKLGEGSTFWFELEFDQYHSSHTVDEQPIPAENQHILLVGIKDHRLVSIIEMLEKWSFEWDKADDVSHAYKMLENASINNNPYNVILVDEDGLDMDARLYAQRVQSEIISSSTNLVLISDESDHLEHQSNLESGYFCILTYPIEKRLLFNTLHATSIDLIRPNNVTRLVDYHTDETHNYSLNILIGEDNPTNQKVIRTILEYAGHSVFIVDDGEQVLDETERNNFDLIILDMHMPVMDGIEAAKIYRFTNTDLDRCPIIILTADATTDAFQACKEAGVDAYLTKPIDSRRLLALITSLVNDKTISTKTKQENMVMKTSSSQNSDHLNDDLTTIIDIKVLEKLSILSKDKNFMRELIHGFIADSEETINQIGQALERQHYMPIRDFAHALKGSARSIGAISIANSASVIQNHTMGENHENLSTHLDQLRARFKETQSALLTYLDELNSAVI